MSPEIKPYFPPLKVQGSLIDLSHLNPFQMAVESEKAGRSLRVLVRFTTHCFTKVCDPDRLGVGEFLIQDEGKRPRVFCPIRHGMSASLPAAIRDLNQPKIKVWQTASGRNWTHSTVVEGYGDPYHLFFEIRRAPESRRRHQDIEITVESAYPVSRTEPQPRRLGPMAFVVLAGKVFLGQPVATRR